MINYIFNNQNIMENIFTYCDYISKINLRETCLNCNKLFEYTYPEIDRCLKCYRLKIKKIINDFTFRSFEIKFNYVKRLRSDSVYNVYDYMERCNKLKKFILATNDKNIFCILCIFIYELIIGFRLAPDILLTYDTQRARFSTDFLRKIKTNHYYKTYWENVKYYYNYICILLYQDIDYDSCIF